MILCLGTTPTVQRSMIFERVETDGVNRAIEVREYASGKSPNVARVLHSLGTKLVEVGFAGGDRGKFLLADLQSAGIPCDFVAASASTRLCTTAIDRSAGTATELVEESAPIAAIEWAKMDAKLESLLPQASTCVLSGSLPPGAPQDFYAKWLPLAASRKTTVIIDTRGEPLRLALKHPGFIAKLNREELESTLQRSLDTLETLTQAIRQITPPGGGAIVTMGSKGALACDGKNMWKLTAPKVTAVSAVGSGDAFAAGLAYELDRGCSLAEALSLAAACGAANALTALAGHVALKDVERLRTQAIVEQIS